MNEQPPSPLRRALPWAIVLLLSVALGLLLVWYLFPARFTPVTLSEPERQTLERKLARLEGAPAPAAEERLAPEPYSEAGASRAVTFSERELNALLARNTDLAEKVAIDLADDLVSLRMVVPLDPDLPLLGGQTLRLRAGAELAFRDGRPVMVLKGVSLWGVPLPNAWLGGLKNIDLVREFGGEPGFWRAFAEGIDHIEVREGRLTVQLKE